MGSDRQKNSAGIKHKTLNYCQSKLCTQKNITNHNFSHISQIARQSELS